MKTRASLTRTFKFAAVALSAYGLFLGNTYAAEKGAERLQRLTNIRTFGDAENVRAGDRLVMVCSKCKTVMMHTVSRSKGRAIPTLTAKHLCAGCNSTIEAVGHGKAKTDVVKHVCSGCGDESVFCCATGKGGAPTPGMEKH
jgi:hypothetical protein